MTEETHGTAFAAECYISQIVQANSSTRRTWSNINFSLVKKILFPINFTGNHWTLLVLDKNLEQRIYVDPLKSGKPSKALMDHINKLSDLVHIKTKWNARSWKCLQPSHCKQLDSYNCGVYVCYFAQCLIQGANMTRQLSQVDLAIQRQHMLSTLWGSCYDDVDSGRNAGVCKICSKDDGDDWLGCDRCCQFFHANCIGVDFATALAENFYCRQTDIINMTNNIVNINNSC